MKGSHEVRLSRLEAKARPALNLLHILWPHLAQVETFAAAFDDGAATLGIDDLMAMPPLQHCAWNERFNPDGADLVDVFAMHGGPLPAGFNPDDMHL